MINNPSNKHLLGLLAKLTPKERAMMLNKNWSTHNQRRLDLLHQEDRQPISPEEGEELKTLQNILDLRRALGMRRIFRVSST